jgi:hypothetical protein
VKQLDTKVAACTAQVTSLANNLGSIAEDLWRDKAPQHLASLPSSSITSGGEDVCNTLQAGVWLQCIHLRSSLS